MMNSPQTQYQVTKKVKINYQPHLGQALFHASTARFRIVCCGRKWGKTTMLVWEAFRWLGRPNSIVWWVAPYFPVAQLGWRRFLDPIHGIPEITVSHRNKRDACITMINGSQLYFKSADNPDSLLGEGIDLLIMDEAARIKEDTWLGALRPNLDDPRRVGHMAAVSTPRGHNWFYKEWLLGIRRLDNRESWGQTLTTLPITNERIQDVTGGWPSWQSDFFTLQTLEEALGLPRMVFLQEYGARFLSDLGAVFRDITKAVKGRLAGPIPDENYYMGVDVAKTIDYTVITILNPDGHVVYCQQLPQGISWPAQVNHIARVAREYNEATILIDGSGLGDPVYDYLKIRYPHVQCLKITNPRKVELIDNLAIAISSEKISYPDIPELLEQLSMFGIEQTAGGRVKYEAPKGWHDDYVISLALAAWLKIKAKSVQLSYEIVDFPIF